MSFDRYMSFLYLPQRVLNLLLPAGSSRAGYVQREKPDRVSRALRTFHRTAPALVSQRSINRSTWLIRSSIGGCVDNMRVQQLRIRRTALSYSLPGDCSSAVSIIRASLSACNPLATWCGSSRRLAAYLSARYSSCRRVHAQTTRPTSTALPATRNSIQWCCTKYRTERRDGAVSTTVPTRETTAWFSSTCPSS